MTEPKLPEGFVLDVSTAAAQIEGVPDADGRCESIWDRFARRPGAIERGERPGDACDHYRRWRGDLDLIAGAGLSVPGAQVGVILSLNRFKAATDAEDDVQAASFADLTNHRSFTGPLLEGTYPSELAAMFPALADEAETMKRAPATLDWLGVNYYGSFLLGADVDGRPPTV